MKLSRRPFTDLSIKRKIIALSVTTSTLALLLACLAFFTNEALTVRSILDKDLQTQAEVIARNCGAALSFNDPTAAEEILQSLKSKPHVLSAYVLGADNRIFAHYRNPHFSPTATEESDSCILSDMTTADGPAPAETELFPDHRGVSVKEQGKNHFQFFSQDMQQRACRRLELHNRLRRAPEQEEFTLHYQPKVDLATRTICGVEALIRWDSPGDGLVLPGQFIPVAEETGLIIQMEVETEAQMDFLQEHGCHEIQGFLCGPPMPPNECGALLPGPAMRQVV